VVSPTDSEVAERFRASEPIPAWGSAAASVPNRKGDGPGGFVREAKDAVLERENKCAVQELIVIDGGWLADHQ
jgi:hypothetical protein